MVERGGSVFQNPPNFSDLAKRSLQINRMYFRTDPSLTTPGESFMSKDSDSYSNPNLLQGIRVLVADDSVDCRSLVRQLLIRRGALVETAEDGEQCLRKALQVPPFDLVLCDLKMPLLDGFKVLQKAREQGCPTPIIVLTANAMKGIRQQCLQAGFSAFLTKPIQTEKFYQAVLKYSKVKIPA